MEEVSEEIEFKYFDKNYMGKYLREALVGKGEEWEFSLAREVMNLHNGTSRHTVRLDKKLYEQEESLPDNGTPPKVIFVTATAAIPYAFAIRESWKTAYPNEDIPKFFFIDVSDKRFAESHMFKQALSKEEIEVVSLQQEDKLRLIGEKYNAFDNTAVFDEFVNSGTTIRECQKQFTAAGFTNVNFMLGQWGAPNINRGFPDEDRPVARNSLQADSPTPYRSLVVQNNENSRDIISDMKALGKRMGEQIIKHSS